MFNTVFAYNAVYSLKRYTSVNVVPDNNVVTVPQSSISAASQTLG